MRDVSQPRVSALSRKLGTDGVRHHRRRIGLTATVIWVMLMAGVQIVRSKLSDTFNVL